MSVKYEYNEVSNQHLIYLENENDYREADARMEREADVSIDHAEVQVYVGGDLQELDGLSYHDVNRLGEGQICVAYSPDSDE